MSRGRSSPAATSVRDGTAHAQFLFETPEGERLTREIVRFLTVP
jgi:hypothetical protein